MNKAIEIAVLWLVFFTPAGVSAAPSETQPGQATSYSVGMLKLVELRERAQRALGKRFEVTRFHDVVLGSGPLPLPLLEENVDAWIRAESGRE